MTILTAGIIFALILSQGVQAVDSDASKKPDEPVSEQNIIKDLLSDYDWRVRPAGLLNVTGLNETNPVIVEVNLYLRSISKIDDVNMEYSAQFTFREKWADTRLAYQTKYPSTKTTPPFVVLATGDKDQQIWMPDTFFQNEKEARRHQIDKPNVLIRIHRDGRILYSVRLTLTLSCPMRLQYYPLDRQTCLIDLASYAYTTRDIDYKWKEDNPVQMKTGLEASLPSFELQKVETAICTSTTNTGKYSCLRTRIILRREFSYYLLQLYIPSFMLVIVSWVSFWLDKDSVPARVTLGVTTLLTMTTQSSGINAKLPPVSYTKAIDVWIGVCLAFIFGALLEFALVNYAARRDILEKVENRRGRRRGNITVNMQQTNPSPHPAGQVQGVHVLNGQHNGPETGYPHMTPSGPPGPIIPGAPQHQMMVTSPHNLNNYAVQQPLLHSPLRQDNQRGGHGPSAILNNNNLYQQSVINNLDVAEPSNNSGRRRRPRRRKFKPICFRWLDRYNERAKRIDVFSRLAFPVGFFVFNCVYWSVYMM